MHGKNIEELYRQSRRAVLWSVVVALSLGVAKLAGGLFGHSLALLSDSVHSLGDALAATSVLGALLLAQQPADREHPYGHTRAEAIAGSSVALLLILSGLWVGWEALHDFSHPAPPPEVYTLVIAAVSVLLNEGLYQYSSRVARRTGSRAVLAASWDQRLDAFGSLAVLVGLTVAKWGGTACHAADHVAALAVALVIFWAGGGLFWGSVQELMDRQAEPEVLETVRREALAVPGVAGVEKLLVRKTGLEYLVDIHIEVAAEIPVREGHAIGHVVKDRLVNNLVTVRDVLVHIEPAPDGVDRFNTNADVSARE
jgi:cation diffusion facilitator family transporter